MRFSVRRPLRQRRHPLPERRRADRRRRARGAGAGRRRGHRRRQRLDRPDGGRGGRRRRARRRRAAARLWARLRRRRRGGATANCDIVCFLDGDGSDVPAFMPHVVGPVAGGRRRFRHGLARARPARAGQHDAAADCWPAGSPGCCCGRPMACASPTCRRSAPFASTACARSACASRPTAGIWKCRCGWRRRGLRILEIPVDHRCRRGGVSKVSGNLVAGLKAAWKIATTFLRLAVFAARRSRRGAAAGRGARRFEMRVLLTGGAGFIGRHVLRELLRRGHEVRVLDSLRPDVHADRQDEAAGRRRVDRGRCARRARPSIAPCAASKRCCISPPRSASASMSATCRTMPRPTMPARPSCWPAWRAPT